MRCEEPGTEGLRECGQQGAALTNRQQGPALTPSPRPMATRQVRRYGAPSLAAQGVATVQADHTATPAARTSLPP